MADDNFQQEVANLGHIDAFQNFMEGVASARDQAVRDLKGAEDGKVRELSGYITALTDILDTYDWETVRRALDRRKARLG